LTIPIVTGKKHKYIEISAFGSSPVKPMLPSTTMIIGAIARIGMVWEAMIQGSNERSRVGTWTMPTASRMPNAVPMPKPSSVEDRVTQL
jgi:hypothetical protein